MTDSKKLPMISVGIPVYNGEKQIRNVIESVLNQTYQNWEIIISDNASTDKTVKICEEFTQKDERIKLFVQQKNNGPYWNYNFVMEKSVGKYFVWFAIDDIHEVTFLEKNFNELENDNEIVASISNVEYFGVNIKDVFKNSAFQNLKNKFKYRFNKRTKHDQVFPTVGKYEDRATLYLRMDRSTALYSLFRNSIIKECFITKPFAGSDLAIILNVLKHGHIHVIDEVLMKKSLEGYSSKGIISYLKKQNTSVFGIIFMNAPFTIWCARNLGLKIFMKNLDWFFLINIYGEFLVLSDIIKIIKKGKK